MIAAATQSWSQKLSSMAAILPIFAVWMTTRAVFLDALGTIVELEPPWMHLAAELGIEPDERLVAAVRKEMAYYRDHAHEGTDEAALADLRDRCAAAALARARARGRGRADDGRDPVPSLCRRGSGAGRASRAGTARSSASRTGTSRCREVLERCGLAGALDGVVTSAGSGARKPDPAIFAPALELAGCGPERGAARRRHAERRTAPAAEAAGIRCAADRPRRRAARSRRWPRSWTISPLERQLRHRAQSRRRPPPPPAAPPPPARRCRRPEPPGESPGALPRAAWGPARTLGALGALLVALFVEVAVLAVALRSGVRLARIAARRFRRRWRRPWSGSPSSAAAVGGARALAPQISACAARGATSSSRPWSRTSATSAARSVVAALLAPEQEDVTRELGVDEGAFGAIAAGVLDRRRRPVHRGGLLPRLHVRRHAPGAAVRGGGADPVGDLGAVPLHRARTPGASWSSSTIFGLWLSWLYERTGSLWPPIAVHAFNNAIAFAILTS